MRWLARAIAAVVDAAAEVVEDVVNAVVEVVTDIIETVGNALGDFFHAIADLLARIPFVGRILAAPFRWAGNVISAAFEMVSAVIKAVVGFVVGIVTGLMRIVGGILTLNGALLQEGLGDLAAAVLGLVLMVLGKLLALAQTIIPVQGRRRPLTAAERAMLARIYRNSLALYNIRIVDTTAGVFSVNSTPFTLGNTIYLKGENVDPLDPNANEHVLVHESLHAWQYQHDGSIYIGHALGSAVTLPNSNTIGGWLNEMARGRQRWQDFNDEAQAWFVEDVYRNGSLTTNGVTTSDNGVFFDADGVAGIGTFVFDGVDHTVLADRAVRAIRGQLNTRLSQFLN